MAELVADGANGLLFPIGDAEGLAAAMRRAATEPRLWQRLVAGIRPPADLDNAARAHLALYRGEPAARAA
jgi:glycosyltransferase involved in cell wall biosynthesis